MPPIKYRERLLQKRRRLARANIVHANRLQKSPVAPFLDRTATGAGGVGHPVRTDADADGLRMETIFSRS